jgi:hypothetical protein
MARPDWGVVITPPTREYETRRRDSHPYLLQRRASWSDGPRIKLIPPASVLFAVAIDRCTHHPSGIKRVP